ncbi:MAG: PAS domain S-box protein [Candidatus Hodarchaeales archaeon]
MFNEEIAILYFKKLDENPSSSNKQRKKSINYFLMFLDKENLNFTDGLESKDLVNFVKFLSQEKYQQFGKKKEILSPRTVYQIITLLKSFFKFCFDKKILLTHPDLLFDDNLKQILPKFNTSPKPLLTEDTDIKDSMLEIQELLDKASDAKMALLWTLYNSMTSLSVVLEAKLADLDLEHKRLLLRDKKSNTVTEIILYDRTVSVLGEYINKHRPLSESENIFLSKYREKLSTRSVQRYMRNHSLKILGRTITPHNLKQLGLLHVQKTGASLDKIISHRIQTEKALKASEAKYQTLVETMMNGLLVIASDGTITYANQTFCEMIGCNLNEVIGSPASKLSLGESIQKMIEKPRNVSRSQIVPYEKKLTTKQGEIIWTNLSPSILYTEPGDRERTDKEIVGTLVVVTNITKQKQAEEQLKERKEYLEKLQDTLGDALFTVKLPERKIEYVNRSVEVIFGYKAEECVGKPTKLFYPDDKGFLEFSKKLTEVMQQEKPLLHTEHYLKRKNGEVFPAEITTTFFRDEDKITKVISIVRDITDRKRAEDALREEKNRFQKYLDIAGTIIIALDKDQTVKLINKKGCEILEYEEEEIVGKNWFDNFLPERIKEEVKTVFQKILSGEISEVHYFENPIVTKKGEERIIAWYNSMLMDGKGNITGALSSGADITDY